MVWIVEHDDRWFATLTEAGMLAKIGLNQRGPRRMPEHPPHYGGRRNGRHADPRPAAAGPGTDRRTVDEAIELLTQAKVTASSAVTVATPGDVAQRGALTRAART